MRAECWGINAFELCCWRRLLRVPWTSRRSNQSILKEISPDWNVHWKDRCWSWNSNPLATWCEELTHLKRPWCWARLRAGGEGDDRGWDGWMASPTQWTRVWVNSGSWWWTGRPGVLQSMRLQSRTRLSDSTEPSPQQTRSWEWPATGLGLRQFPLALAPRYCPLLIGGFDKVKKHTLHKYKKSSLSPLPEEDTSFTDVP